mmetsp:Transcript_23401/g.47012  ORF Transcript_23401/g.47012 Transcript_23401/m.47012 type:complete len:87 (-) Transcript_23401:1274-1534(-)
MPACGQATLLSHATSSFHANLGTTVKQVYGSSVRPVDMARSPKRRDHFVKACVHRVIFAYSPALPQCLFLVVMLSLSAQRGHTHLR